MLLGAEVSHTGFNLHGIVAYIDTLRGLMMWDTREHQAPPGVLPADLGTHHSAWLATAPIEGGIFYTLPCGWVPRAECGASCC